MAARKSGSAKPGKNLHVSKSPAGGWQAKRENAQRASARGRTQSDAEAAAKRISGNSGGGEVRIHGRDGKIRDSDTVKPGNDPSSSRDRKH